MKTIIAGSRSINDIHLIAKAITESGFVPTEVVSGGASGADALGEQWAFFNNVPVKRFPANWAEYGRAAGPIRNKVMAEYGEALVAVWDGTSAGTKNMIDEATKRGLKVYVYKTLQEAEAPPQD